jgi:uncharacterized protein (DUF2336 family)
VSPRVVPLGMTAMTAIASALVAEIEGALQRGSLERRGEMLLQITALFLSEADRLTEQQIDVFGDVFIRVMQRIDAQVLMQFSTSLAESSFAPREVIRQLACHEDGSIAVPVLLQSSRLTETDLVDLAGSRGQRHLLALSGRRMLAEAVTDALLKRGDSGVFYALASNVGARFSEFGYQALIDSAERDDDLAEKLGMRLDIPTLVLRKLLAKASGAARFRLLKIAPPEIRGKIEETIRSVTEQIGPKIPRPVDYTEAQAAIRSLNYTGRLNDSTISRFALEGKYTYIVTALSVLSSVPIETIESLISGDSHGLVVACRASRLDWSTTVAVIRHRPHCQPVSVQELEEGREVFESLSLSAAQWSVRIRTVRNCATEPQLPAAPVVAMARV